LGIDCPIDAFAIGGVMTVVTDTEYIIELLEEQNDMILDMQKQIDYLTRIVLGVDDEDDETEG